jgi:hypothetical protein
MKTSATLTAEKKFEAAMPVFPLLWHYAYGHVIVMKKTVMQNPI